MPACYLGICSGNTAQVCEHNRMYKQMTIDIYVVCNLFIIIRAKFGSNVVTLAELSFGFATLFHCSGNKLLQISWKTFIFASTRNDYLEIFEFNLAVCRPARPVDKYVCVDNEKIEVTNRGFGSRFPCQVGLKARKSELWVAVVKKSCSLKYLRFSFEIWGFSLKLSKKKG